MLLTALVLQTSCAFYATQALSKVGLKPCPEDQPKTAESKQEVKRDPAWLTETQKATGLGDHLQAKPWQQQEGDGNKQCREPWAVPVIIIGVVPCIAFDIVTWPVQFCFWVQGLK